MTLKTLYPKRDDGLSQINLTKEHPQDIGSGHGKSEQELNLFSYQSGLPNPTLKHQPKTEITDSSNPPFAQFVRDYLHMLKTQKDWSDGHYQNVQNRIEKFCRFVLTASWSLSLLYVQRMKFVTKQAKKQSRFLPSLGLGYFLSVCMRR